MRMLCFGDSNTWGWDPRSYLGDRYPLPWPALLARATGWEVINLGENGREIPRRAYELEQVRQLLGREKPDLLIVLLGTNDLLQGASAELVGLRMEAFLQAIRVTCPNILLAAPPALKLGAWVPDPALVTESHRLAECYAALDERLGMGFANGASFSAALTFDGVHLSEAGHVSFARGIREVLTQEGL